MKQLSVKNKPFVTWEEEIVGLQEDQTDRINFDFNLRTQWIDEVIGGLDENLKLFFRILATIDKLSNKSLRNAFRAKIEQLGDVKADVLVDRLKAIYSELGVRRNEPIPTQFQCILEAVKNLRQMCPTEKDILPPHKRKRTLEEKLQWITGILAKRARISNLKRKIQSAQGEIKETKQEMLTLLERSSREIHEAIEQSELELGDVKESGDEEFAQLQEEVSKKILDVEQIKEYHDLLSDHDQKRRRITKLTVQLQQWIKQYDKFVGEPMKELLALEANVAPFEEWKETVYDVQEEKLKQLKASVEVLEDDLTEEQVAQFAKEHAARVIQRGWRRVLEKKKAKKKGKKGKKKGAGKKKKKQT